MELHGAAYKILNGDIMLIGIRMYSTLNLGKLLQQRKSSFKCTFCTINSQTG